MYFSCVVNSSDKLASALGAIKNELSDEPDEWLQILNKIYHAHHIQMNWGTNKHVMVDVIPRSKAWKNITSGLELENVYYFRTHMSPVQSHRLIIPRIRVITNYVQSTRYECHKNDASGDLIQLTVYSAIGNHRANSSNFFGLQDNIIDPKALSLKFSRHIKFAFIKQLSKPGRTNQVVQYSVLVKAQNLASHLASIQTKAYENPVFFMNGFDGPHKPVYVNLRYEVILPRLVVDFELKEVNMN